MQLAKPLAISNSRRIIRYIKLDWGKCVRSVQDFLNAPQFFF